MYTIYKRTTPDGKVYIGCTKQSLRARAGVLGAGYRNDSVFWEAIQKFGWDSVKTEVLAETDSVEAACDLEISFIKKYDSLNPDIGLNSRLQHYVHDAKWSEKLSQTIRAACQQDAVRKHMSSAQKARFDNPEEHTKISASVRLALQDPEVRLKISQAGTKRYQVVENRLVTAEASRAAWCDPYKREQQSVLIKKILADPELRSRISINTRRGLSSSETRLRMSTASKLKWADPNYKTRVRAAMKEAANQPERREALSTIGKETQNRPEVKAKIAAAFTGLIFVNNGIYSKRVTEEEALSLTATDSWVRGRLAKGKGSRGPVSKLQGRVWIHKEDSNKFVPRSELPSFLEQGWLRGRK